MADKARKIMGMAPGARYTRVPAMPRGTGARATRGDCARLPTDGRRRRAGGIRDAVRR